MNEVEVVKEQGQWALVRVVNLPTSKMHKAWEWEKTEGWVLKKYLTKSTTKISGIVNDNSNQPLRQATISFLKANDSSLIKTELSGNDGKYEFSTSVPGSYIISYVAFGFEKRYSTSFTIKDEKNIRTYK